MRSLLTVLLILLYASIFSGCSNSTDSDSDDKDILGKWYFYQSINSDSYEGDESVYDSGVYDPGIDNYYHADIIEITSNNIIDYNNEYGLGYDTDSDKLDISNNSIVITDDDLDTYAFAVSIENDMMIWEDSWAEGSYSSEEKVYWKKYTGSIPPVSWVNPLPDDSFEPDSSYSSTLNSIIVGAAPQIHTITWDDSDWFKFSAMMNNTYLIKVTGGIENGVDLNLYNTDGMSEIYNYSYPYYYDFPENVQAIIIWECETSGVYFFNITSDYYNSDYEEDGYSTGYYTVEVELTDLDPLLVKTSKSQSIRKNTRKMGFLNN